jgi:hypothetical protein
MSQLPSITSDYRAASDAADTASAFTQVGLGIRRGG